MLKNNEPLTKEWGADKDFNFAEKAVIAILKDQKVSIAEARLLFNRILEDAEYFNPISD